MFGRQTARFLSYSVLKRQFHCTPIKCEKYENPFLRTLRILRDDFTRAANDHRNEREKHRALMGLFPRHADVVIIGGGAIGSSIAYWLKEKTSLEGIRVVVLEKDLTYSQCATRLSTGALHQQFSQPENIEMALFGAEFIRKMKRKFGPDADVRFTPHGYLLLASEEGAQQMIDNTKLQRELGAFNTILSKDSLKERFPWMNVDDVELGCLGLEKEGWFDPWAVFTLMRNASAELGAQFIEAEAVDFTFHEREDIIMEGIDFNSYETLDEVVLKTSDGEIRKIKFACCILAAGANTGDLAQLARIGCGSSMLAVPLPFETRTKYVYKFNCLENSPGINSPMTVDHSGVYFRRCDLAGSFIAGIMPSFKNDPDIETLGPDKYYEEKILPFLTKRVPAFDSSKMVKSWTGLYEYNSYDDNGVVGPHPYYHNLYIASGFNHHGTQHVPALGRAVAEMILDGDFKTIDLTRLGFDRLIVNKPMYEIGNY